ncbi:MAG: hypothetical protein EPN43_00620 [Jatrophihabitans sp.]|nr:MAG: hypothetical protein EPN43_00620 [Jatrophihabitans sp.]
MPALLTAPDPAPWWRLARVLAAQADELRAQARRIVATAESTRWNSPAATVFTSRARQAAERAVRIAGGMDEAAATARHHAVALAKVAASLASAP